MEAAEERISRVGADVRRSGHGTKHRRAERRSSSGRGAKPKWQSRVENPHAYEDEVECA